MRLHGVACAMRDFKRSLRPDATNPVIIVVPDRLAAYRLKDPRLGNTGSYSQALVSHIAKLWLMAPLGHRTRTSAAAFT